MELKDKHFTGLTKVVHDVLDFAVDVVKDLCGDAIEEERRKRVDDEGRKGKQIENK